VIPATQLVQQAAKVPENGKLQMVVQGETLDGKFMTRTVLLPLGKAGDGVQRLADAGLELREDDGKVLADNVMFGSEAQRVGIDFDWEIVNLQADADRPPKHLMFIPALILLALIWRLQLRRKGSAAPVPQRA